MANPTRNMLLQMWDQINDLWFSDTLVDNFERIDKHDHSDGRGVQIPAEGIADGAITLPKLAADFIDTNYKKVFSGTGLFWETTAQNRLALSETDPALTIPDIRSIYRFDPAEWGVTAGAANKMKVIVTAIQLSRIAPDTNFAASLIPVTGVSNGFVTTGAAVFTLTVQSPGARNVNTVTATPAVPAAGYYIFSVTNDFDMELGSELRFNAQIMVRK